MDGIKTAYLAMSHIIADNPIIFEETETSTHSHSVSNGTSHTDSVSDSISKTLTHGFSDSKGISKSKTHGTNESDSRGRSLGATVNQSDAYTAGEAFNLVNTKTMTDTFGSSRGITLNAQNMTLNLAMQRLQTHLERM